jgi:signal transduction histidine kinase
MPSLSRVDLRTRSPIAFRRPELLHAGAYLLVAASGVVEFVRIVVAGAGAAVIGALLVTVAGAALAWWRPWPGLVGAVAGCAISAALGWDPIVMWSITVFVLFSFTLQGKSPVRGTLFTVAALYVVGGIADGYHFLSLTGFPAWVSAAAGGAIGSALRIHQQYWASLEQRTADAIATRESEAIRRVAEERLRIARDLHDVVGHQVAVVSMHLGVAEVNLPADADPARAALASARTAVRSVLLETQRILNLLRRGTLDDDPAGQPAPELSRLPELVDSYRQIGLQVDATLGEMPDDIDPAVSLTAYRIVQEALTNAHRHGDGTAELSVTAADGRLLIEMVNARGRNGAGRDVGSGFGLVGVRERVTSAGGRLTVTDDDEGPFRLTAALTTDGSDLR